VSSSVDDSPTTYFYHLSLHDALPISMTTPFRFLAVSALAACLAAPLAQAQQNTQEEPDTLIISDTLTYDDNRKESVFTGNVVLRSEEHTSELQSRENLVCRLLLEKKK